MTSRRGRLAMATVLSTVILGATLLTIVWIAYAVANGAINSQLETASFDQSKYVLTSLSDVVKKIMFTPDSSGYVRVSFTNLLPYFTDAQKALTINITDPSNQTLNRDYSYPIKVVKIKGGSGVGVSTERDIVGVNQVAFNDTAYPLAHVKAYQSDGAWLSLDYARARCVFIGVSKYFEGSSYRSYNVIEITVVNMILKEFAPGETTLIVAHNAGTTIESINKLSKNLTIDIGLSDGSQIAQYTLQSLGGDAQKNAVVRLSTINIEISMLAAG
jgi:hypothetical protein